MTGIRIFHTSHYSSILKIKTGNRHMSAARLQNESVNIFTGLPGKLAAID